MVVLFISQFKKTKVWTMAMWWGTQDETEIFWKISLEYIFHIY